MGCGTFKFWPWTIRFEVKFADAEKKLAIEGGPGGVSVDSVSELAIAGFHIEAKLPGRGNGGPVHCREAGGPVGGIRSDGYVLIYVLAYG